MAQAPRCGAAESNRASRNNLRPLEQLQDIENVCGSRGSDVVIHALCLKCEAVPSEEHIVPHLKQMNQDLVEQRPIYGQLDSSRRQIRLLSISPSIETGRIECRLSHTILNDSNFVVLSYRWGSEDATYEIGLNSQPFYIRPNLWEFLNVIRKQDGMILWIDALCINQQDSGERSQQVRIMGDIFKSASMVLSWLGPAHESSSAIGKAFDLMSYIWNSSMDDVTSTAMDPEQKYDNLPVIALDCSEDHLWECVATFCSLKYWDRAWVVQEILLSGNNCLLYGEKLLQWQMFANFLTLVDVRFKCPARYSRIIHDSTAKSYALSKPYKSLPTSLQWQMGGEMKVNARRAWDVEEFNLFRILSMFGHRECTVPLDHVYALLSLTCEGKQLPISYSIEKKDLFITVFYFCAEMAAIKKHQTHEDSFFWPASQRAFFRNAKYLAEIIGLVVSHDKTQPYSPGSGARAPHPKPDPCWPRSSQTLVLYCQLVVAGNEPPLLRSNTLQQRLADFSFDVLLHLDESASWLLCRRQAQTLILTAVISIKDNAYGRGFKILDAGSLSGCPISLMEVSNTEQKWHLEVEPRLHLALLTAVILGEQPG